MKRRSFLAGLLAAPLAKLLPAPQGIPQVFTEDLKVTEAQVDFGGMDQTSIWICSWGDGRVYAAAHRPVHAKDGIYYMGYPVLPMRTNWLKKELNK